MDHGIVGNVTPHTWPGLRERVLVLLDLNSLRRSHLGSACTLTCNVVSNTTSFELVGTMS